MVVLFLIFVLLPKEINSVKKMATTMEPSKGQ